MNCLFVGAGAVADSYAEPLADSPLSLAAVCDLDAGRAESVAGEYGARAFTDLDRALRAVDAPIVVNLTGHGAHAAVTERALAAGRHVYSQKPLALDGDRAGELVATARRRDLGLSCAPAPGPAQRLAGRLLADGRTGDVRLCYAHAHVGRVTEWHDRPDSFLEVGPLYDGGVYPLALLVAWFGPVERVRSADSLDVWPDRADRTPSAPSHVEATLSFAGGPVARLSASLYAPHRAREFYGIEFHGDDGSVYLGDAGALGADRDTVQFGRAGRGYTPVPPGAPPVERNRLDPVEEFAAAVAAGRPPRAGGRRAAHVVAVCNAIERAAETGESVAVDGHGAAVDPVPAPAVRPTGDGCREPESADDGDDPPGRDSAIRLPTVGFGCSRYRGDRYVDRVDSIARALDAGYRLLDSAELYGNEHRIGDLLAAPGAPDREALFVLGKVWRTNHRRDHLLEACAGSREELGIEAFDCYALHWPGAWAHQGHLERLAEQPVERREALTFPTEDGEPVTADVSLTEAWTNLEVVHERGWARTLGLCNVSVGQLRDVLAAGEVEPALVQVERHPYRPRTELVEFCHERGVRVVAHSPLSAPGLLDEAVLAAVAEDVGLSPAGVVLAWNVTDGVVPIPASVDPDHVVANRAAGASRLPPAAMERVAALEDPGFER